MMTDRKCQQCGASLDDSSAAGGLCAVCLLRAGLAPEPALDAMDRGRFALPHTFGPYELIQELGRGGMGVVYAARQPTLNRKVAVKLLLAGAYASEIALRRFRTEAAAAAGLQHPNIVEIHDYGEWEGQPYYVMDLVAGRSLAQECEGRPLDAVRAATIVRDLADAVHHAHQQGVLHRDLKPSNVLLDERDRARITDFGLARRLDDDSGVTQSGQIMGSPGYTSPEQASGRVGEVGVRSDVYGLGAILYHLVTGRAPFNAATPTETLRIVLESDPLAPRLLNPGLPRDLETICLKCLAKEPGRRYASAVDVRDDLQRFLEHRPIHARPPNIVYRTRKFVRRYRTGVAAVAAVVATLAVGLMVALFGYRRAVEQQQATDAARARSQEMVNFIMQKSLPQIQALGRRRAMIESAQTAVRYFEQLPPALRDRETIRAHASALDVLVQAYGNTFWRGTSRDPEASRASLGQAAALWRQLAESDPADADAMASALFDEYIFLRDDPNLSVVQRDAMADERVRRYRDLDTRFPDNEAVQVGLGRMLRMQTYPAEGRRIPAEAVAAGQEACARFDALLTRKPGDTRHLWDWAWTCNALAMAYDSSGDRPSAVRCLEEGVAIAEGLLAKDPMNLQSLELAAILTQQLVWTAQAPRRTAEWVRRLRGYTATLVSIDPEDPEWRMMDAKALFGQAGGLLGDRLYREASQAMSLALERWESLPPELQYDRLFFADAIRMAGDNAAAAHEDALAVSMCQRLQGEFMAWADDADTVEDRSQRTFYCLYFQGEIRGWMGDWTELERLAREMLAEAEQRVPEAPDTMLLHPAYRAGARAMLGKALVEQGRSAEAVPFLEDAVAYFRTSPSMAPFYQYPPWSPWEAAEDLARALRQTGDRQRIVELFEWSYEKHDADVRNGSPMLGRVQLAQCAWQLASALDPDDPTQATRRQEVLARALELLDDPGIAPRLTPEERELRAKIADSVMDSPPSPPGVRSPEETGT